MRKLKANNSLFAAITLGHLALHLLARAVSSQESFDCFGKEKKVVMLFLGLLFSKCPYLGIIWGPMWDILGWHTLVMSLENVGREKRIKNKVHSNWIP